MKEHNIKKIDNSRWPYSSSSIKNNEIHKTTDTLLRYIRNQGAKEVFYKVKKNDGDLIRRRAHFSNNLWSGEDCQDDQDNYTFKWVVKANSYDDPYGYVASNGRWSCI